MDSTKVQQMDLRSFVRSCVARQGGRAPSAFNEDNTGVGRLFKIMFYPNDMSVFDTVIDTVFQNPSPPCMKL